MIEINQTTEFTDVLITTSILCRSPVIPEIVGRSTLTPTLIERISQVTVTIIT